jgi:hypothetical protein
MALTRNFQASSGNPNEINLVWDQPLDFNNSTDEIIITRAISHFPVEIENTVYPDSVTDTRPIEIFRGSNILGICDSSGIGLLEDSTANFSTNLRGRLVRDSNSRVYRIVDNTSTSLTLDTENTINTGPYVILSDFPQVVYIQKNFEPDIRTEAGPGFIKNLVSIFNGQLTLQKFSKDELANLVYQDSNSTKRIIKSNTTDTIFFYDDITTPAINTPTFILNSFSGNTQPLPYIDNFKTESEANVRSGNGLRDNVYYYYTAFNKPTGTNVAQAKYAPADSKISTQASAISVKNRNFGKLLYSYWPGVAKDLDVTKDLEDLMKVFGFQFEQLHALIEAYKLQDADRVFANALPALADQTGLPSVGYSIGVDTLRRIARDMIPCWKIKGSKEGIGIFIRKITTWDITSGLGNYGEVILDFLPNVEALRFFSPNLGTTNIRITQTGAIGGATPPDSPEYTTSPVTGGRFAQSLPGIVIPGFFTFREFVVILPNVALLTGISDTITTVDGNTIITDPYTDFGMTDGLVGNFVLPNEGEINDIFKIIGNTTNSITLEGTINNKNPGGKLVVLSPLNKDRFVILNSLLPYYIPYGTKAGFTFENS